MNNSKSQLFGMLLHAGVYFKLAHFDVSGPGAYSAHLLYEHLYKTVDDIADTIIETEIGESGLYEITVPVTKLQKTPYEFIEALIEYIEASKKLFEKQYHQDLLNQLEMELAKAKYKLKFLK